jgi:hypothetical protein
MKGLDLDLLLGLTQDFKRFSLTELHLWYLLLMLVLSKNRRFQPSIESANLRMYRLRTDLPSATSITEQVLFQRLHKRIGGLMYIHFVLALEVVEISVLLLLIFLSQGVIIHLHLHSTFLGPRLVMLP